MSRLSNHQQKQLAYKAIFFFVLLMAFIILLATYGFRIIINGSLLINELANSQRSKNEEVKKDQTLTSLMIDPPPSATSSSQLSVSGSTVNFDIVEVYLNHEKMTEVAVINDVFADEIRGLEKGENSLYFIAKSKKFSQTKKSSVFTVIYKDEKPTLEITDPNDNSRTNKQEIKIAGKTGKETYIKINGQPVVVDANGGFQTWYKLNDGDNIIEIVAEDIVGNEEKKSLKITYAKDD
ncbi:hypothetical protein A2334_02920 [Candidatus Roizmanbacteria bacterium RIFOXYB2_FULL_38_10]|uniref:Bacterial Ig domain-containing protein n=1 Tax=Candidatus Roizmanbacteria bacterium RIFOXYD1_FULL_38_12 TaxID=1802093 RepID=A0A1F7L099_9BACT|nr:MAG: hypothetical protein A3K47_02080 [Candidatus Roizmanbacteria bacterium RIFOXYA2_FULL_38_14]OGK63567.1 MAG: hypothetical protein A3K27_02080 [Candidatus Roizmanbacteria bacterium RIFOXYA1_FULL_37_12]OGK65413.1 MAG: hypothetical protein A3K38_02080 [Candidatus Roizmanbacteria bacterium RIFOXYB1_FULL_40_23]OGK69110.1 MAG: hypothetical protein A2334_02920 [Candidatus Roizmanbacteria bacterium RIFOXYB2_FULL_38_10]OGK69818.1 MAG: hypothetical protein A3K21_02085 [Candidatus Roizmanbacteria ba